MSTPCRIAMVYEDGSVKSIYCHHDGYVKNGVGEILTTYYTEPDKIKELIGLGDISVLGTTTEHTPDDWGNFSLDCKRCLTYRDRGDADMETVSSFESFTDFIDWLSNTLDFDLFFWYIYANGDWYLLDDNFELTEKVVDILQDN